MKIRTFEQGHSKLAESVQYSHFFASGKISFIFIFIFDQNTNNEVLLTSMFCRLLNENIIIYIKVYLRKIGYKLSSLIKELKPVSYYSNKKFLK